MSDYPVGVMVVAAIGLFSAIMMARNPSPQQVIAASSPAATGSVVMQPPPFVAGPEVQKFPPQAIGNWQMQPVAGVAASAEPQATGTINPGIRLPPSMQQPSAPSVQVAQPTFPVTRPVIPTPGTAQH